MWDNNHCCYYLRHWNCYPLSLLLLLSPLLSLPHRCRHGHCLFISILLCLHLEEIMWHHLFLIRKKIDVISLLPNQEEGDVTPPPSRSRRGDTLFVGKKKQKTNYCSSKYGRRRQTSIGGGRMWSSPLAFRFGRKYRTCCLLQIWKKATHLGDVERGNFCWTLPNLEEKERISSFRSGK